MCTTLFERTPDHDGFILTTQQRTLTDCRDVDIEDAFAQLLASDPAPDDAFVTLEAPGMLRDIRYIQAATIQDSPLLHVEAAVAAQEADKVMILYRTYSRQECLELFLSFYDAWSDPGLLEIDLSTFTPLEF